MRDTTLLPALDSLIEDLRQMNEAAAQILSCSRPILNGERYLTDKELVEKLSVSKRTLQTWRNEGFISYYSLGGKIIYKESDIEEMLSRHFKKGSL